jgi:hypothetical protein
MHHGKQILVEAEDEALAHARQRQHHAPLERRQRRIVGAHEEGARHARALDHATEHARAERPPVELDVREFGHGAESSASRRE